MTLFIASNAFAQVDYSYCGQFIDENNAKSQRAGIAFPFKINPTSGELERTIMALNYNGGVPKQHTFNFNGPAGSEVLTVREKYSHGKISSITIDRKSVIPGAPRRVVVDISFEVKNGKCFPSLCTNNSTLATGANLSTTVFDTKLCREIKTFFEENNDLNKCFDPDSKENIAATELLRNNGYDTAQITQKMAAFTPLLQRYGQSVEQKILSGSEDLSNYLVLRVRRTRKIFLDFLEEVLLSQII